MRVAVVGAGVVGLACAWELAGAGAEVTVYEAGAIGGGVSRGNAGWICPSISSPFAASPERFEAATAALLELNRRTMNLYDRYREEGVEFEMHETGLLITALSDEGLAPHREFARLLHRLGYDGAIEEIDGPAAAELEPALDGDRIAGALHARLDRHVRPETLTAGLAQSLRLRGATLREQHQVESVDDLDADKVVVAAGLASAGLLRLQVPLVAARGYSTTLTGSGAPPSHAIYLAEEELTVTPYAESVRIAGVVELGARTATAPPGTAERLVAAAEPYLKGWRPSAPAEAWAGLRPATADGLPLIGAVPGRQDVFVAAGHAKLGITLAPATAAALAPLVLSGERSDVLAPFAPGR